jgi:hypothetical protein
MDANLGISEQDKQWIKLTEMKIVRRMAKYTWQDYETNENTLSEFKFNPVCKKFQY